jgi:DNA-binding Lrp family transcriptional regulator
MDFEKLLAFSLNKTQEDTLKAMIEWGSQRKAAKALGMSQSALNERLKVIKSEAARRGYAPDIGMNALQPEGQILSGVSTLYDRDGNVTARWVKMKAEQEAIRRAMLEVVEGMTDDIPRAKPVKAPDITDESLCNLMVFTDYHFGQLAWHREGGANYNLQIAEKLMSDSFTYMIKAAPRAKTGIVCLCGDQTHTDSLLPLTPAHKNVLDADGRFSKIVAVTIRSIRRIVSQALAVHENVHLVICEGNHDEAGSVWLRQMFTALYENEPRITVNDSELPFYVHQHGETMLGFHHGHKVKNEQLPALFAAQYSKMWGETRKRYAHCGHRHHVDEKEYSGMTVIQHPTLAARDAYAARGGWISDRAASVITYHEKYGQVGRVTVCPEMFESCE